MKIVAILSLTIKNCVERFNFQSNCKRKNICFTFQNERNVFRFCSSSVTNKVFVSPLEQHYCIHDINKEHITKIVPFVENDEKLNTIISEIEHAIIKKRRFPEKITVDQLKSLVILETRTQRLEYLSFLFKKERYKIFDLEKRENKKKERKLKFLESANVVKNHSIEYGLGRNTMLLSVRKHAMIRFYKYRFANSTLFGQKIVLDLGYDPFMTQKEKNASVTQLALIHSVNRNNRDPYDLHFCNAIPSYASVQRLQKFLPKSSESFVTLTEKSYLDIFPKEKLVYLSPHAEETLKEYDHNAVYIIGAFVDTVKKQKISFNKADTEGIKSYSLPLDEYILWGAGTKSLTVNQVFEIMLSLKNNGDWKKAFEVVPPRKIRRLEREQAEKQDIPEKIFLVNTSS